MIYKEAIRKEIKKRIERGESDETIIEALWCTKSQIKRVRDDFLLIELLNKNIPIKEIAEQLKIDLDRIWYRKALLVKQNLVKPNAGNTSIDWTDEKREKLLEAAQSLPDKEIAKMFNTTEKAISQQLLKLKKKGKYQGRMIDKRRASFILNAINKGLSSKEIAKELNMKLDSFYNTITRYRKRGLLPPGDATTKYQIDKILILLELKGVVITQKENILIYKQKEYSNLDEVINQAIKDNQVSAKTLAQRRWRAKKANKPQIFL